MTDAAIRSRRFRERMTPEDWEREKRRKRICTPARIAASQRYRARQRAAREAFEKKLGKLLNLSVNGATAAERQTALRKYHSLKERRHVA